MERRGVIVNDNKVINVIVWGDETDSQLADDGYQHYEETTDWDKQPAIGWTWAKKDGYRPPSPYPSWVWSNNAWAAPVQKPTEGEYQWNEDTQTWDPTPETPVEE